MIVHYSKWYPSGPKDLITFLRANLAAKLRDAPETPLPHRTFKHFKVFWPRLPPYQIVSLFWLQKSGICFQWLSLHFFPIHQCLIHPVSNSSSFCLQVFFMLCHQDLWSLLSILLFGAHTPLSSMTKYMKIQSYFHRGLHLPGFIKGQNNSH